MRAGVVVLCAVAALLAQGSTAAQDDQTPGFASLQTLSGKETRRFRIQLSRKSPRPLPKAQSSAPPPLPLFFDPLNPDGCVNVSATPLPIVDFGLVVRRGNCTFADKARAAQAFAARALFVVNTVDALYGSNGTAEAYLVNPCSTDCQESASGSSQSACEADCRTGVCAANPRARAGVATPGRFCCALNELIPMEVPELEFMSYFVGVADAEALVAAAEAGARIQTFKEDKIRVDGSAVIVLLLGTVVTALASYRAAKKERVRTQWVWQGTEAGASSADQSADASARVQDKDAESVDAEIESVTLNMSAVVCFLLFCTASLIGLFFLAINFPRETVITVQVLFGLGSVYALSYFVVQPLLRAAAPVRGATQLSLRGRALGRADAVLSYALAVVTVCIWFAFRHASWAWVLLNLLGASVCCMFLTTIRVPNLQLAVFALSLFFVYDVFMVFISPELFDGKSVMVEVATAGGATANIDPSDNAVCERTVAERMPMLFMVPRFDGNGFALLGLGDIFIPGLLITYGCRVDYLRAEREAQPTTWRKAHRYFLPLVAAYGIGLALALLANIFRLNFSTAVQGQPALLYLVPLTAGGFVLLAWARGDLPVLWKRSYDELQRSLLQARSSSDAETGEADSTHRTPSDDDL